MSNYPDGITGNEWQIKGAESFIVHRECDADCGWSGGTDAEYYAGEITWECPVCGMEYREVDYPDDPFYDPYERTFD